MEARQGAYEFGVIEGKWQKFWEENKTFRASEDAGRPFDGAQGRPKYYVLDMFPYPSAQGLHVGHPEGYTASDIVARFKRAKGFNVLHPMGWDAFGLPAEQYAIQTGTAPEETTGRNVENMRRQIKSLGFSYDWQREVNTTDPKYYRWTQWVFLKMFNSWFDDEQQRARGIEELEVPEGLGEKERREYVDGKRLAYEAEVAVNWCPALGTVLANEEVVGGLSERGGHPVFRRPMRQWMLRITKYAERLLKDLEGVEWPESIKKLQVDWVGKSVGAEVDFVVELRHGLTRIETDLEKGNSTEGAETKELRHGLTRIDTDSKDVDQDKETKNLRHGLTGIDTDAKDVEQAEYKIKVFTTRPDTLFGATYMVLAPEHPLVDVIASEEKRAEIEEYRKLAATKSDLDRTDLAKEKTGVFVGAYAVNPVNGARVPIWISDYVLISYGTGAIMAVPAHDDRDFEFAKKFGLEIIQVVRPGDAKEAEAAARGEFCFTGDGTAINSGEFDGLPTREFKERITDWLEERGVGKKAVNYKLRDWLFSRQRYWGEPFPIVHAEDGEVVGLREEDLPLELPAMESYEPTGSGEPPLAKAGDWLNVTLPDGRKGVRETNTMPQWAGSCWYYLRYLDPHNDERGWDAEKEKYWMNVDLYIGGAEHAVLHLLYSRFWHKFLYDLGYVSTKEPFQKLVNQGMILGEDGQKMSKSRGNVVNPDKVIADYGADSMRLYEMFMGPLESTKPWSMQGVEGVHRFLQKVWRMVVDEETGEVNAAVKEAEGDEATVRLLHQTIKKVGGDIESFGFNTAISAMMIFVNHLGKQEVRSKRAVEKFLLILAPFAPHIAEELWERLGHKETLAYESWPEYDEELVKEREIELAVQVRGKIKDKIVVGAEASEDEIRERALASERVIAALEGKEPKKVIVVKSRLVNIVV